MSALPQIGTQPDFRHVEAWVFDLDNTLYSVDSGIFAQVDRRMTQFVAELLTVGESEARAIQKNYYREHGTTLNGLMHRHDIDPERYLNYVHDIDLSPLAPNPLLDRALSRLKGKRYIFTNGCGHYAARVLARLDLARHFDEVWDIRTIGFRPKPNVSAYETVVALAGILPAHAAMFDDIARNLVPASNLGVTTVWIRTDSPWSGQGPAFPVAAREHIDYETDDLAAFLSEIRI